MYTCSSICVHLFIYLCTPVHLFVYICSSICVHLFIYLCTSAHLFMYICSSICVHLFVYLCTSVRLFVYICSSICMPEQSMYHCIFLKKEGRPDVIKICPLHWTRFSLHLASHMLCRGQKSMHFGLNHYHRASYDHMPILILLSNSCAVCNLAYAPCE